MELRKLFALMLHSNGGLSVWGRSLTSPHPRRASAAMLHTAGSE